MKSSIFSAIATVLAIAVLIALGESICRILNAQKNAQKPPSAVTSYSFLERDPELGTRVSTGTHVGVTRRKGSQIIYSVNYSVDNKHRRETPQTGKRNRLVLFFADSLAFGEGVNDNETLPYFFASFSRSARVYNYGTPGHGPQQLLARLEEGKLGEEVSGDLPSLIYIWIDAHINRAIGDMRQASSGSNYPYYELSSEDQLVRKGTFSNGRPLLSSLYKRLNRSSIVRFFGLNFPKIGTRHVKFAARILKASAVLFNQQFKSDRFYVLLYPGCLLCQPLKQELESSLIKVLDYSKLFERGRKGLIIEGDGHPSPQAYKEIAFRLAEDLKNK
ncbi:MAG: hypothetical protein HY537_19075 [Deltaproteobacteria bacterium]|nr:hypothetical protein [Deltaproteobacteria bacterium]